MKIGLGGVRVDLIPCLALWILPKMDGIDCSRCLRMSGDDSPGQVVNHPASMALQNVYSAGHPALA